MAVEAAEAVIIQQSPQAVVAAALAAAAADPQILPILAMGATAVAVILQFTEAATLMQLVQGVELDLVEVYSLEDPAHLI